MEETGAKWEPYVAGGIETPLSWAVVILDIDTSVSLIPFERYLFAKLCKFACYWGIRSHMTNDSLAWTGLPAFCEHGNLVPQCLCLGSCQVVIKNLFHRMAVWD